MPPLISVVGKSKSGKTYLLEKLVPELVKRGYRVAVFKHAAHGFDLDREGKDSHRLMGAGSGVVMMVSPSQLCLLYPQDGEPPLSQLPRYVLPGFDLLLAEGFRQQPSTKIETHRQELGGDLLCQPSELWAVVSDASLSLPIPTFSWEDISGLADLIGRTFPRGQAGDLELFVNGLPVNTNPFVKEMINKAVVALVSTLKGVGEIQEVELRLRQGE